MWLTIGIILLVIWGLGFFLWHLGTFIWLALILAAAAGVAIVGFAGHPPGLQ